MVCRAHLGPCNAVGTDRPVQSGRRAAFDEVSPQQHDTAREQGRLRSAFSKRIANLASHRRGRIDLNHLIFDRVLLALSGQSDRAHLLSAIAVTADFGRHWAGCLSR